MPEDIIIGAGLAGLSCATHLTRAGVDVVVQEASDTVGGRVRTDVVDGVLLDRGFQVHNTGYPEARRMLDHDRLALRPFAAGALIRVGDRLHPVGDPRRQPAWLLKTATAPIGSLADKAAVVALAARAASARAHVLWQGLPRPELDRVVPTANNGCHGAGPERSAALSDDHELELLPDPVPYPARG